MGITAYSTSPKLSEYREPISEDLMMKGTMMDAKRIDQADNDIQNTFSLIEDIPSLPGADTERKNEIMAGIQEQVKGMSYNDLRSPAVTKQIKNYIQQVSNNPDLVAIAERGNKYKQDLSTYQALTSKGKQVSPWNMTSLNEANDYINSNTFIKDKRFSGNIQEDPEIYKGMTEAMKLIRPVTNTKIVGGQYITTEEVPLDKLNQVGLAFIESNPQIKEDFKRKIDYQTKGTDWNTLAQQHYAEGLAAANYTLANKAHISPTEYNEALQNKKAFESALQSPNLGDLYKNQYVNEQIGEYVNNSSSALNSLGKIVKQTEVAIHAQNKALDYQYDKAKEIRDLQIKTGISPKDFANEDEFIKTAQAKVQQDQLDLTQGKQDIKDASKSVKPSTSEATLSKLIDVTDNNQGIPSWGKTTVTSLITSNPTVLKDYLAAINRYSLAEGEGDITRVTPEDNGTVTIEGDFEGTTKKVTLSSKEVAGFLKEIQNKGISTESTKPIISVPKPINTQQEYDNLSPGQQYLDSEGNIRTKS